MTSLVVSPSFGDECVSQRCSRHSSGITETSAVECVFVSNNVPWDSMPVQEICVYPSEKKESMCAEEGKGIQAEVKSMLQSVVSTYPSSGYNGPTSPLSSPSSNYGDMCRICHCEAEADAPLIAPCICSGSLRYVHQECLQQWIKSSDTKKCELCKFEFIMQTKIKPFRKWEKLEMSSVERRKIFCSVTFHVVAITCVVWSLYVLIDRTAEEMKAGMLEWPFWTKLIVVAIGFTGGLVFMYVQCKMYVQLCRRWKAFNRIIYVQNAPPKAAAAAAALITSTQTQTSLSIYMEPPPLPVTSSKVNTCVTTTPTTTASSTHPGNVVETYFPTSSAVTTSVVASTNLPPSSTHSSLPPSLSPEALPSDTPASGAVSAEERDGQEAADTDSAHSTASSSSSSSSSSNSTNYSGGSNNQQLQDEDGEKHESVQQRIAS